MWYTLRVALWIAFTGLELVLAWRVIQNVRRVEQGRHPEQLLAVCDEEPWLFGPWDDERGLPEGETQHIGTHEREGLP